MTHTDPAPLRDQLIFCSARQCLQLLALDIHDGWIRTIERTFLDRENGNVFCAGHDEEGDLEIDPKTEINLLTYGK